MAFEELVKDCVRAAFDDAEFANFGLVKPLGKVGGVVMSHRFEGMDQVERQTALWQALRDRFAGDELRNISLIMTFTPDEFTDLDED